MNSNNRIYLNISNYAYNVLRSDYSTYQFDNMSALINAIVKNYIDEYVDNINAEINMQEASINDYIEKVGLKKGSAERNALEDYCKSILIEKKYLTVVKYPKEKAFYIRLQNNTLETLYEKLNQIIEYNANQLTYPIRVILEEYARKSSYERECILYFHLYKHISQIIDANKVNEHSFANTIWFVVNPPYKRRRTIKPYRITTSDETATPFLLAIQTEKNNGEPIAIPLSSVVKIENGVRRNNSAKITVDEQKLIEKYMHRQNTSSDFDEELEIKISFSYLGLKQFLRTPYNRPWFDSKTIRENGNKRYVVNLKCTERQAIDYFTPFGKHAVIVHPLALSQKLQSIYKESYEIYESFNSKSKIGNSNDINAEANSDYMLLRDIEKQFINVRDNRNSSDQEYDEAKEKLEDVRYYLLTKSLNRIESISTRNYTLDLIKLVTDSLDIFFYPYIADLYFESDIIDKNYIRAFNLYKECSKRLGINSLTPSQQINYANLLHYIANNDKAEQKGNEIIKEITKDILYPLSKYKTEEGFLFYSYPYEKKDNGTLLIEDEDVPF